MFDKIGKSLNTIGDKLTEAKTKVIESIPEVDYDFITKKLNDLGYKTPKIEIHLTLPPAVLLEIDLNKSLIDNVARDKILNEDKDDESYRTLRKILQGLDQAAKMSNKIKISNKKLSRVIVEGSLIPSIRLVYLDDNIQPELYQRDFNNG